MRKTLSLLSAAILMTVGAVAAAGVASANEYNEGVCAGLDSGKIDVDGEHATLEIFAPEGMVIVGYCVKAGSIKQGDGPQYVPVDPGQSSVVISHTSGKDISHYSADYAVPEEPEEPYEPTPVEVTVAPPVFVSGTCDAPGSVTATDTADYTFAASGPDSARILTASAVGEVVLQGQTVFGPYDLTQLTGEECEETPSVVVVTPNTPITPVTPITPTAPTPVVVPLAPSVPAAVVVAAPTFTG